MSIVISKADRQAAFAKVFGGVKSSFSRRTMDMQESGRTEVRLGKTARDKANGHVPYVKNRRILDQSAPMCAGTNRRTKVFIKA